MASEEPKNVKLKGKGGLSACPACGSSDISAYDQDYIDSDEMIQKVGCNKCGRGFTELWRAVEWEES